MTCEQAREIPIVELLKHCHIHPRYVRGQDHWYLSPFRDEKTPSFKVNGKLNLYYDHGSGQGGDVIDLGRQLFRCDTKELLEKLGSDFFSFQPQHVKETGLHIHRNVTQAPDQSPIQITGTKDLGNNPAITRYLVSRRIDLDIARPYCREVYYQVGDRNYFAAGFENRSGGYELRSEYFKGSSSPKDITHIERGHKSVCVLEGFTDFLSLLSLRKPEPVRSDFVVLNSVNMAERSLDILRNYRTVFVYPDHDAAGNRLLEKFEHAQINCVDASGIYQNYKDLNQMLVASKQREEQVKQQGLKRSRGLRM
ncbi:5S rRNA maturation endonuclease (ribonuclease M5) [Dyadobacter sp. BE34]|uniref:5S rRNA maturation endonuclease (Ribonuclease M5) n=1 Tax=Dyadobacter fermentans TaxID=94254 RepID=A0ABU1R282_9BACT|nr:MULTISPECIES: toprim domain-containing protein [Dyadobacter]MDR6807517.1 5S rRNA maturation endonuclease (ribonuclease M5) [Dyadobacter fermentans]MDR7045258.1 5S rRNA maturation endonuclease (ribonuclease M5) [Dyadobacter sp. BE242]MDR7199571.1 5S rRNA maturation endonuclease (ribonuclease M5) [Dyadobacter sp. BE34]MDR7217970.1 5S rRNA maturation endonuclease (ribonuclease M5) [Dyadobacter sp. BE31]MDR7265462.1 5S rRNA maturation endonuclease (ribonuclease M5) [Dyadobacter sp. BE32]